jgi:hypothetical protein
VRLFIVALSGNETSAHLLNELVHFCHRHVPLRDQPRVGVAGVDDVGGVVREHLGDYQQCAAVDVNNVAVLVLARPFVAHVKLGVPLSATDAHHRLRRGVGWGGGAWSPR